MNPELKIKDAHKLAVLARQRIEQGGTTVPIQSNPTHTLIQLTQPPPTPHKPS